MPPQSIESQPYWNILYVDKSINIRKRFTDDKKSNVGSVIKFNHGKNTKLITTTDEIEAKIQFITPHIDVCKDIQMDLTDITVIGKNTIPWWSVFAFFIIGSAQLIFGVVMNVFSVGAADLLGIRLIMEGAYDIGFATKEGIVHRELSWKFWLIQKSISFTLMLVFVGNAALNNAFNMIMFWRHGNIIFTQSVAEGWILALQIIILEVAKTIGVHIVDGAVERGVNNLAMPQIQRKILKSAEETLSKSREVRRLLEIDARNGNNINETAIKKKVVEIASPPQNRLSYAIINGFVKGLFNSRLSCLNKIFEYVEMLGMNTFSHDLKIFIRKIANENNIKEKKSGYVQKTDMFTKRSVNMHNALIIAALGIMIASQGFTNVGMNQIMNGIDISLQSQMADYKAESRIEFAQNGNMHESIEDHYVSDHHNLTILEAALELVDDLANNGEAGLIHVGAISDVVGRPIKIIDKHGRTMRHIGGRANGNHIEVQYHPPNNVFSQGHWTLPGGKEPEFTGGDNDCLFDVVANQTGGDPQCLRLETVFQMLTDLPLLASQIKDIDRLKAYKSTALLEGGARYEGTKPSDASSILDNSQGRRSANSRALGHPRGHASDPSRRRAPGNIDCVENYSYDRWPGKSGFLSTNDQNNAVHRALISDAVKDAMQRLNDGSAKETLTVWEGVNGGQWWNGNRTDTFRARGFRIVLEHQDGQQGNPNADVFVRTVFPIK